MGTGNACSLPMKNGQDNRMKGDSYYCQPGPPFTLLILSFFFRLSHRPPNLLLVGKTILLPRYQVRLGLDLLLKGDVHGVHYIQFFLELRTQGL